MIRRTVGTALSMCLILTAAALDLGTPDFRSAAGPAADARTRQRHAPLARQHASLQSADKPAP